MLTNEDVVAENIKTVLENAFEQAVHGITTTQTNLNTAVSNAEAQLSNFEAQLNNIQLVVRNNDKEKFTNIIDDARNKIQEWKLLGQEHKTDINDCVVPNEKNLGEILSSFLVNDGACLDKEYGFELSNITGTKDYIKDVANTFKAFEVEKILLGCMEMKSLNCINDFKTEISKLSTSLPAEMTRKLQEVMILMNGTPARLEKCSKQFLAEIETQTTNVVELVSSCAKKIIGL